MTSENLNKLNAEVRVWFTSGSVITENEGFSTHVLVRDWNKVNTTRESNPDIRSDDEIKQFTIDVFTKYINSI